jgi:hypothetical protein
VLFKEGIQTPLADVAEAPAGPSVLFGSPRPPTAKGDTPRVLAAGEVRQRIPCTETQLLELEPAAPASVLSQAIRIVDGTNLDDHHFDDVIRFGAPLQAEHGRLAEEELALVDNEALAKGKRLGAELLQHLADLDPEDVFALRSGVRQAIRVLATGGRDPGELFSRLYPRIRALAKELDSLAPDIAAVVERLRGIGARYVTLDRNLAAHVLAGRYLVRHVGTRQFPDRERQAHFASQADAIETRVASLMATQATAQVGRRTLEVVARNVDALAGFGEGLLREELPAWHTAYSAALMAARSSNGGPETVSSLRDIHARILARLTPKG